MSLSKIQTDVGIEGVRREEEEEGENSKHALKLSSCSNKSRHSRKPPFKREEEEDHDAACNQFLVVIHKNHLRATSQ